jgi:hypothetical protein
VTDPDAVVRELLPLVRAFCAGEEYGVALGGSHAKGTADAHSDVDVYLFADAFLPAARRVELVTVRLGEAARAVSWGADEPFVEGGTDFSVDGVLVECWLRGARQVESTLAACVRGGIRREHKAWTAMGFFEHVVLGDVHAMRVVEDPAGMLARWKATVATYPEPLRDTLLRRFMAEAAFWPENPHYLGAVERGDVIYTSAIVQQTVQALIQVVFALDRVYFPGEKKLADALEKLPSAPRDFAARIQNVLCPGACPSVADLRAQSRGLAGLVRETRALVAET